MADIDDNPDSYDATLDQSEINDQMDTERTLVERGVEDPLDEGIIAPDHYSGVMNEALEGRPDTIDEWIKQEDPERERYEEPDWDGQGEDEQPRRRAGRLVDANDGYDEVDHEHDLVGYDVGVDGGAASAEEAAVRVVDEDELFESEQRDD